MKTEYIVISEHDLEKFEKAICTAADEEFRVAHFAVTLDTDELSRQTAPLYSAVLERILEQS